MKTCLQCSGDMNVLYVFKRRKGRGRWVPVGHLCLTCGLLSLKKKIRLVENVHTSEAIST